MAGEYDSVELGEVDSVQSGFAFKSSDWTESGIAGLPRRAPSRLRFRKTDRRGFVRWHGH